MEKQMELQRSYFVVRVQPGEYYLGDPCYAIQEENGSHWDQLLDQTDYFRQPIGRIGNHFILGFDTKYGDGGYPDQHGNVYPVDAGLIGLVPKEYVEEFGNGKIPFGMRLVEFDRESICHSEESGLLVFGNYEIMTGDF